MKQPLSSMRSVVITLGPGQQYPWWWDDIRQDRLLCELDYVRLNFRGKKSQEITTLELPFLLLKLLPLTISLRRKYDYVFSFECDFVGMGIAFWQSIFLIRRPRHVILQFIMREKTTRIASRVKHAFLNFIFRSVHKVICSSRSEAEYYCSVFGWKPDKACFVPFHTNPRFVSQTDVAEDSHYLLAAGRTFRDYDCAIEAIKGTPFKLVIVGGAGSAFMAKRVDQVQIFEEVSLERLTELMAHCVAVVVPLLDRKISTGQSIFLQAMALGKPVIATRTSGTADYFEHMVTGILVDPGDVESLRSAMHLMVDHDVRRRIGQRAQEAVRSRYLPHHYTAAVREVLTG